jgi:hypothetical protein
MARFWSSSTVASAPAASAGTNAASTKTHGRLVRQMDESNTTNTTTNALTDENLSQHAQHPRTPEQKQKATRPLRPRSASRDAGTNATNNSNLTGGSNLFSPAYSSGGGDDTYDWSESSNHQLDPNQQLDGHSGVGQHQGQQPNSSPRRARMNSRDIPRSATIEHDHQGRYEAQLDRDECNSFDDYVDLCALVEGQSL